MTSTTTTDWEVLDAPGLVTVQDDGRLGLAHLGVPRAGPLDPPAAALAGRLVGDAAGTAVLEVTLGGVTLRAGAARWVAVTGARCAVTVGGSARGHGRAEWVPAGAELRLGPATSGVRSYLAVGGGWAPDPVLGSRSTDTLAWVGPPRVVAGLHLPVGAVAGPPAAVDVPGRERSGPLRVDPGPRLDRFAAGTLERLCATAYVVGAASDRVGLRLEGEPLVRVDERELASEGMVLGAVQVPPDGRPVVLLADHPVTGGYPMVAVVRHDDLALVAQLRPGEPVSFRPA
ncbi:biotin-dependent carboxyltransferase family protein [Nocardioides plantarum]|uniref:Biotin-dependent carboxyltransferase family protein n=1 Tax=Nocardioides plantarum TaxID=29299 RepID=A0ABV5KDM2_9ACTN|nr:biotin-dependent carboxyltransferase family protein [Nocardioides plantarum]